MQKRKKPYKFLPPKPERIEKIAKKLGIKDEEFHAYGWFSGKISLTTMKRLAKKKDGCLILVTGMTPTKYGEGKTVTTIGIAQSLALLGKKSIACIRQPSLGPVFGIKGGASGGGCATVLPEEKINLHFTGDIHAVQSAHNLLSAMIDNHLHFGNELRIEFQMIIWPRAIDMNDRALREIMIGKGEKNGPERKESFIITAASEVMAILALAENYVDLQKRLGEIIVAYNAEGKPVKAKDLKAHGAMAALLRNAMRPNLVQTYGHSPAFIHAGPFGNIAHGCSSLIATKMALKLADFVVTEAGFGSELGAEKFFDIKCRLGKLRPQAAVIVASIRAMKHHGGCGDVHCEDLPVLVNGFANLQKHIENVKKFGVPCLVALNLFKTDTKAEVEKLRELCKEAGVKLIVSEVYGKCGPGGVELAKEVIKLCKTGNKKFKFLYGLNEPIKAKIAKIAHEIYGAGNVKYSPEAEQEIAHLEELGFSGLPICMAKTQASLSDDEKLLGRPEGFVLHVRNVRVSAGAGFIVVLCGKIMTMPGLPKEPMAEKMSIDEDSKILGI